MGKTFKISLLQWYYYISWCQANLGAIMLRNFFKEIKRLDGNYFLLFCFLFIISAFQAFYHSQIITWKIANIVLIVTSYLYNATYNDALLLLDYFDLNQWTFYQQFRKQT